MKKKKLKKNKWNGKTIDCLNEWKYLNANSFLFIETIVYLRFPFRKETLQST